MRTRQVSPPSATLLRWFHAYLHWFVPRYFHSVGVSHQERFRPAIGIPTIVMMNHPSWWDPIVCLLLARALVPDYDHYAPMDEAALQQYRFFARLGLFPVEPETPRGAAQFLRGSEQVLRHPRSLLWVTPQGRFCDARQRPPELRSGLGALVHRTGRCRLLTVVMEYTYWDERLPEALMLCGEPLEIVDGATHPAAYWTKTLQDKLIHAQEELAVLAQQRNPGPFTPLLSAGAVGTGSPYEAWRRLRSVFTRAPYIPRHSEISRKAGGA